MNTMQQQSKINLHGYNNLTKSLSFSLYKLHYVPNETALKQCGKNINQEYNAKKLTKVLTDICHAIGGNVLNIAQQDYQPHGASSTLMISEEVQAESLVGHLDKSHLCIHTYPDDAPQKKIAIFRADIELSTCGVISPLKVLNSVIYEFKADVIDIDYRVRGMTRDLSGKKQYNLDDTKNISEHFYDEVLNDFHIVEHSLPKQNIFHAKLSRKNILLTNYLLTNTSDKVTNKDEQLIIKQLHTQIKQLFTNTN